MIASLKERLPPVRGRITENAPLAQLTWFRVGGMADILFKPADQDDLVQFLKHCPADIPITVLGVASNIIIRDGGVEGVVIRLGREFTDIVVKQNRIVCGAAALDLNVALVTRDHNLTGLEFLSGIPGTIGGALRMNAGAYGREIKDVLISADAIDHEGNLHTLTLDEMQMSYRCSGVPGDWIFTRCELQAALGDAAEIQARINAIKAAREESQPTRARTGGSTFANPDGRKAWQLIDESGCRGLQRGGAQVSELHCNFMLNTGDATAKDLENLGEEVRAKVLAKTGITLEWEIKRIGRPTHNASLTSEEKTD